MQSRWARIHALQGEACPGPCLADAALASGPTTVRTALIALKWPTAALAAACLQGRAFAELEANTGNLRMLRNTIKTQVWFNAGQLCLSCTVSAGVHRS